MGRSRTDRPRRVILETDPDQPVTSFWQISVLRAKIASMTTNAGVTDNAMTEDGPLAQSTRRQIIVRPHGSRSTSTDTT